MRNDKILKILKIYPYVVLCIAAYILLTLQLSNILASIGVYLFDFMFFLLPIFCVVMIIATAVYVKKRLRMQEMTAETFLTTAVSIKSGYKNIYTLFIMVGAFCAFTFFLLPGTFLLCICGWGMLVQTGIISGAGALKAYREGRINTKQAVKFGIGQCILYLDIRSAKKLLEVLQGQS